MFANATYFSSDPALEFQVWSQRLFGAFTTSLGILLTSLITGFVVDAVRERMEFLKEGKRLHVIEYNHIVMIGLYKVYIFYNHLLNILFTLSTAIV